MALSPVQGMLTTPYPFNISLSTGYRLVCRVMSFTPCVAMHNNNRFNEAMQVNRGLRFTQSTGEDNMATLPDMLRAEVARCQKLSHTYTQLGTAGAFASALLAESLHEAEQALRRNECRAIEVALERLRAFRDVTPDLPSARMAPQSRPCLLPAGAQAQRVRPQPQRSVPPASHWGSPQAMLQEQFFTWTRAA